MTVSQLTSDLNAFQSAYARLCDQSAQALHEVRDREEVGRAFTGRGTTPVLSGIREQRRVVNRRIAFVKRNAAHAGIPSHVVTRELLNAARHVRALAESEWMTTIPIEDPRP